MLLAFPLQYDYCHTIYALAMGDELVHGFVHSCGVSHTLMHYIKSAGMILFHEMHVDAMNNFICFDIVRSTLLTSSFHLKKIK